MSDLVSIESKPTMTLLNYELKELNDEQTISKKRVADQELDTESKKLKTEENKENESIHGRKQCPLNYRIKRQRKPLKRLAFNQKYAKKLNEIKELNKLTEYECFGSESDWSEEHIESHVPYDEELDLKNRMVSTLDALVLQGCSLNSEQKSILIKEYSKYCTNSHKSLEVFVKTRMAYDLVNINKKTFDSIFRKCPNLKCLRLSYCKVNVQLMKSLKDLSQLRCLHLEYIYGINTDEEWTEIGQSLPKNLCNLAFNVKNLGQDITGMVSKLKFLNQLAFDDYNRDPIKLFSSIAPTVYKLSFNNYHNIDEKAIQLMATRFSKFLTDLEFNYDYFHSNRANTTLLFATICEQISELRFLRFRMLSMSNMRPLFKLKNLNELDLQFSVQKFLDFPAVYSLQSLRSLSLTKMLFTPRRMYAMAKAFPYLTSLSLSGSPNKDYIDSPLFCCECRNKDKIEDNCLLCYENCANALIEFSYLKVLKLNYITVKRYLAIAVQYIPALNRLVLNPFDCQCGSVLLMSAIKIAKMREFTLEIRKCFISDAIEGKELPQTLTIVEYNPFKEE